MKNKFQLEDIARKHILNLVPYSSARDAYVADRDQMVFWDANENPFATTVNRYPDPKQHKLKQLLATQKKLAVDQILLGNGSDEILDLIFRAFCEPKEDNIVLLPPTYGMYRVLANLHNIEVRQIVLTEDFEPNWNRIMDLIDGHTKLVFLCYPNNPTGNSFQQTKIQAFLDHFSGLVVIDEAYIDFSPHSSWIASLHRHPNLIVTQTFSKALGMAGIRLGAAYASPGIISLLDRIKPPYNVSSLTQNYALQRLHFPEKIEKEVAEIKKNRDLLYTLLSAIPYVSQCFASDANFILAKVDDAKLRYQQLLSSGIVVRDRSNQPLCDNCLRVSVGSQAEIAKLADLA